MLRISQKDLKLFLDKNPIKAKVFIGEVEVGNYDRYIFVDNPVDTPISASNKAIYINTVLISVYTTDYDERNTMLDYLKTKFIGSVERTQELEYYKGVFETQVMMYE